MCSYPLSTDLDSNRKGNIAEAAIAFHAMRLGIQVCRPLFEHGRYDLVLEIGGRLLRVQCKWARTDGEVVFVTLVGNRFTPTAGYVRTTYSTHEIDAVAAYCADLDRCYLLPSDLIADRTAVHLRLAPTKNGQLARLHWADQYELSRLAPGVIGQGDGRDQTELQVASASTLDDRLVVPAHDFRGRFGYYMELAGKGTEVHVTRRGRPSVCLVPATPPLPV